MRYLAAALGGFALTLGAFVGGVGFAIAYLTAEPVPVQKPAVDVAMLWPSDPVRVDTRMQDFDRIERRPVLQPATQEEANEPQVGIDDTKTASVDGIQTSEPVTQSYNHLTWCTHRYRSYQPSDNSYMSFSGFKRECISPFSPATASTDDDAVYLEASAAAASFDSLYQDEDSAAYPNSDHIESCFSRYRSYRPEDNSYQPYGGGPRQQCQ